MIKAFDGVPPSELEAGADRVRDEGSGEPGGHRVLGAPAGAVRGYEHARVQGGQVVQNPGDQRLERRATRWNPPSQRIKRLVAGEAPSVAGDVDHARRDHSR